MKVREEEKGQCCGEMCTYPTKPGLPLKGRLPSGAKPPQERLRLHRSHCNGRKLGLTAVNSCLPADPITRSHMTDSFQSHWFTSFSFSKLLVSHFHSFLLSHSLFLEWFSHSCMSFSLILTLYYLHSQSQFNVRVCPSTHRSNQRCTRM